MQARCKTFIHVFPLLINIRFWIQPRSPSKKEGRELNMVAHTCSSSTQEAGQRDRGEFELSLGYRCEFQATFTRVVTRCLKQTKSK